MNFGPGPDHLDARSASGEPLVFGRPMIDEDDIAAVVATLRSGWIGSGPQVEAFEKEFAALVDAADAIAVTSCTDALHLLLRSLGADPGDEVVTTPYTFVSTVQAIAHAELTPRLVDVLPNGSIDPDAAAAAVGDRTRAVLPVHLGGLPADLDSLGELARRAGIELVQDAAHAVEARWRDAGLGSFSPAAYSCGPSKSITTVRGGMAVAPDMDRLAPVRLRAQQGVDRTVWLRFSSSNLGGYDVDELGWNMTMTDVAAALGRSQLAKVERRHSHRVRLAALYDELLSGVPVSLPPRAPEHAVHAWHMYAVTVPDAALRDPLREHLAASGIGTGVHFPPLHLTRWMRERYGYEPGGLPVAEDLGSRTVSLPLDSAVTQEDAERVADAIRAFFAGPVGR